MNELNSAVNGIRSQILQLGPMLTTQKSFPRRMQALPRPFRFLAKGAIRLWNILHRDQIEFNQRVLNILENLQQLPQFFPQASPPSKPENSTQFHRVSDFYLELEKRFRGSYQVVKSRLEPYFSHLPQPVAGTQLKVLDMGVGRGEWLDLMKSRGAETYGVDINPQFVQDCASRGHQMALEDVLSYLRRQDSESLDIISAFHLIEHLPFPCVLELFAEVLRVLRPNGVFIIETPNPENMIVATQTFYLDPTHLHPLPRALTEFVFEYSGFEKTEFLPLHPNNQRMISSGAIVAERINNHFYNHQDYGIIGRKGQAFA